MSKTFTCLRCDRCCYFVCEQELPIVFPYEKRFLIEKARELGISGKISFKPYEVYRVNEGREYVVVAYKWIIRGYCPFYDKTSRACKIHQVKPLSCRMYPLILNVTHNAIHVSEACCWVRNNLNYILSSNPADVFQEEIKALLEAYILFINYINLIKDKYGDLEKVPPEHVKYSKLIDVDKL